MSGGTDAFVVLLWITMHGGPIDGTSYGIPFLTEAACKKAMKPIGEALDYDYSMTCEIVPIEVEMEP